MSSGHISNSELALRIGEVLHYLWDPIGVRGTVTARDEYDMYVPQVIAQMLRDESPSRFADLLNRIEDELMGLMPNRARAEQAASVAFDWLEALGRENHSSQHLVPPNSPPATPA